MCVPDLDLNLIVGNMNLQSFLDTAGIIIDVRTPAEFTQGHIPGAMNIPLFSNEERALVGTAYKIKGPQEAIFLGLELVGPKLASFAKQAREHVGNNLAKIYCWRGGMRSSSMSWLLETAGLQTTTLQGGYKAFRQWVFKTLERHRPIAVIGGLTGSGKTEILHKLRQTGQQILDLEALAKHRGSCYGMINLSTQPTNEQFENEIAYLWHSFDSSSPVWIEDESRTIGKCKIPDPLFKQMRTSPLFIIESTRSARIHKLLHDYGTLSIPTLITATKKIERQLGSERTHQVICCLQEKNLGKSVEILLDYYDKLYTESLKRRNQPLLKLSDLALCDAYETYKNLGKMHVQLAH